MRRAGGDILIGGAAQTSGLNSGVEDVCDWHVR